MVLLLVGDNVILMLFLRIQVYFILLCGCGDGLCALTLPYCCSNGWGCGLKACNRG